jgi:hypothetical protein
MVDHLPVQVETLSGVSHGAAPIAPLEATFRSAGDPQECGLVPVEAGDDRGRDRACEPACGEVADSALCHQASVGEAQGLVLFGVDLLSWTSHTYGNLGGLALIASLTPRRQPSQWMTAYKVERSGIAAADENWC